MLGPIEAVNWRISLDWGSPLLQVVVSFGYIFRSIVKSKKKIQPVDVRK